MNKVFYITCDSFDGSARVEWYKDCTLEELQKFINDFTVELGVYDLDINTVIFPCELDEIKGIEFSTIAERYNEITEVLE